MLKKDKNRCEPTLWYIPTVDYSAIKMSYQVTDRGKLKRVLSGTGVDPLIQCPALETSSGLDLRIESEPHIGLHSGWGTYFGGKNKFQCVLLGDQSQLKKPTFHRIPTI